MVIDVQVRSLPRPKAVLGRTTQTTRTTKVGLLFQYFTVFYSIFHLFTNTFVLFKWPLDSLKYFYFFGLFSKNIFRCVQVRRRSIFVQHCRRGRTVLFRVVWGQENGGGGVWRSRVAIRTAPRSIELPCKMTKRAMGVALGSVGVGGGGVGGFTPV